MSFVSKDGSRRVGDCGWELYPWTFCGGENVKNFKLCQRMESMLFCRSHPVAMKMKGLKCNNKCVAMKAKEMIAVEKQLH